MNWVRKSMLSLDRVAESILSICDRITVLGISGAIIALLVTVLAGCGERLRSMAHPPLSVQYMTVADNDVPTYVNDEGRPSEEAA